MIDTLERHEHRDRHDRQALQRELDAHLGMRDSLLTPTLALLAMIAAVATLTGAPAVLLAVGPVCVGIGGVRLTFARRAAVLHRHLGGEHRTGGPAGDLVLYCLPPLLAPYLMHHTSGGWTVAVVAALPGAGAALVLAHRLLTS